MKNNFFTKNLIIFLIPLLIPTLVLGSLSIIITQRYIKDQITQNNINLLNQTKTNIDLIFNEIDTLNIQFDGTANMAYTLKRVLKKDTLYSSDIANVDTTCFFLNSFANSKPYIYSIHIYYENENGRFCTTNNGITNLNNFFDTSWYDNYLHHPSEEKLWIETRNVKQYDFEEKETKLITVYKRMALNNGVIVLNIKADYIQNLLNKSVSDPKQKIFILDKDNSEIVSSQAPGNKIDFDIKELINLNTNTIYSPSENKFLCKSIIHSDRFSWNYISVIPEGILYYVSISLLKYTIVLLLFSFILGLILTFYLTKKNYKQISNIITIIDSAKNNQPLPVIDSNVKNEFSYIIENLVTTFIEQHYLKVQLSERKYKLENMELIALQSQINPHFLYNTLHTIYWEVIKATGSNSKPIKMIENLSNILDYSLTTPCNRVSIGEEIRYTKTYLEIQMIRYGDKFDVLWAYTENVEPINTIKLLIQPLVENCIYHGIKNKDGKGKIKIKLSQKDGFLILTIIDNGIGIDKENLDAIKNKLDFDGEHSNHIGLFNTSKRLKLTYGDNYGIHINSKLGLGTVIYIRIPISYS
ncbi:cache domain-containing sensor histidine kinase [Clostridium chromiireducens]|uniref:Putative sensor-like histidine kinase n=1 Tax=Clostridium chromiireducens TaxID=225345 RepID=A0A1V4IHE9_9CLOT|nr:sensor histidine kinase [Clostridium chromiireducens]OPJ59356.1 putative sensor-like histidine kinase [Clostridium chromiireducens]